MGYHCCRCSLFFLAFWITFLPPRALAAGAVAPVLSGAVRLPDGKSAAHVTLEAWGRRQGHPEHSIMFWGPKVFTIRTDAHGRYQAELTPPPGWMPVDETAAEWDVVLISQQGVGYAWLNLRAEAGRRTLVQDIDLVRGDRVSGTVILYPGGRPAAGARVSAALLSSLTKLPVVSETRADRKGRFRLPADLPPGEYVVGAAAAGAGLAGTFGPRRDLPPQHHHIELHLVKDFRLRAQVLDENGQPLSGENVDLKIGAKNPSTSVEFGYRVATDHQGCFNTLVEWVDSETKPYWRIAAKQATVSVCFRDRRSGGVTVDPAGSSRTQVVLRLR